jgi:hypothetical protein
MDPTRGFSEIHGVNCRERYVRDLSRTFSEREHYVQDPAHSVKHCKYVNDII